MDQNHTFPDSSRIAIYFTPRQDSLLARTGAKWLGRTTITGSQSVDVIVPGLRAARLRMLTSAPYHYGFHATLKAPFRVEKSITLGTVLRLLSCCAEEYQPFSLPPLVVGQLGDFFCLRPDEPCPPLQKLAEGVVRSLDNLRRPMSQAELARRRQAGLTPNQDELLQRWGYPYVFDEFRFHFSLTDKVEDTAERDLLQNIMERFFEPALREPLVLDRLCLFLETEGSPLIEIADVPLGRMAGAEPFQPVNEFSKLPI